MSAAVVRTSAGLPRFGYNPDDRPAAISRLLTPAEIASGNFFFDGEPVVAANLVARWQGDAGVATDADGVVSWTDQAGGLVLSRLTAEYSPETQTSPGGTAAVLIDTGSGMTRTDASDLPQGAAARTVFLCWRPGINTFFAGFGWGDPTAGEAFTLSATDAGVLALDFLNSRISGSQASGWVVLVATYDGTTARLLEGTTEVANDTVALATGADRINLCRTFGGSTTEAVVGEVLVYDRVLTSGEISRNVAYLTARYITDVTAPTLSAADLSTATSVSLDWTVTTDEGGTLYWQIGTSATPPSQAALQASPLTVAVAGPGTVTRTATLLTPGTTYYVHLMIVDEAGNRSAVISTTGLATAAGDVIAPVLSSPTGAASGANGYTGTVSTNEANGVLYRVVTTSATSPSAAQVRAGQNHTGAAASAAGSQPVTATGAQAFSGSGLSGATTYRIHMMHEDAAGNRSAVATSAAFTTSSAAVAEPLMRSVIGDFAFIPNLQAGDYSPPAHNKTCTPATFATALSGLVDGDVLRLENGSYASTEILSRTYPTGVQLVAQSYGGAVFPALALFESAGFTFRGIRVTGTTNLHRSARIVMDYSQFWRVDQGLKSRAGAFSYSGAHTGAIQPGNQWLRCIIDQAWPSGASGKQQAGILGYTSSFLAEDCIIIRGNEDALKLRGVKVGTLRRVVAGWARVASEFHDSSNTATDYHGDSAQFEGYSGYENEDILITHSAFISPPYSGFRTSQGLFMKDGTHRRYIVRQTIGSASLNGNAIVGQTGHSNTLIENCDAFQGVVRISGTTNTVRNTVCRFVQVDSGQSAPAQSGNLTYGSETNLQTVYQGNDRTNFNHYRLQPGQDQTKGAADLKALVLTRRTAYEASL